MNRLKSITIIFFLLFAGLSSFSQQSKIINVSGHADCKSALSINPSDTIISPASPKGYGKILEFKDNKSSNPFYFEKEHNTVWYKMQIPYTGNMVFSILPDQVSDDYDFILYKYSGRNFCQQVITKALKPVRTNISRNNTGIQSKTGLNLSSDMDFKDAGPGESFSKAIEVKENEIYYLVLDNVYENGKGHSIIFDFLKDNGESAVVYKFEGKISSDDGTPLLNPEVVIEDVLTGEIIATAQTDPATGAYTFELPKDFDLSKEYNLSIFAENHFFEDKSFVPGNIIQGKLETAPLQMLKKNKSYSVTNINFYANSPQYLPESEHVLKKLLKLMDKNQGMHIEIEGHINGCSSSPKVRQLLSEARAKTVFDYLERKGIEGNRMTTKGFGCTKMIYPEPKNKEEEKLNRRVEIKITDY